MTALAALQKLAKERGQSVTNLVDELRYEVYIHTTTDECEQDIRLAAIGLFGAFYDPAKHRVSKPDHWR